MKKKALLLVGILIIALTFSTVLVACNPDKMENIVGTYKLVVDTRDQETNKPVKMTIGDVEYDLTSGLPTRPVQVAVSGEVVDVEEQLCWFNYSEVAPEDYDAYFLGLIEEYEQSLKNAE